MTREEDTQSLEYMISRYVEILWKIANFQKDCEVGFTPYEFEMQRQECHAYLFECLKPLLRLEIDEDESFLRTKTIFANLDKVWSVYDECEFDLSSHSCCYMLKRYIYKFLLSREVLYYIEGTTNGLRHITV